jgi:hypothetical protein
MFLVRLFHVEHSVAVAAGAAFAVPLRWSPGGVGACELSWARLLKSHSTANNSMVYLGG